MTDAYIINRGNIDEPGRLPMFKYTGEYDLVDEGLDGETRNWQIVFLTSGDFTLSKDTEIEVWCTLSSGNSEPYARTLTARTVYEVATGEVERCTFDGNAYNWANGSGTVRIRNAR